MDNSSWNNSTWGDTDPANASGGGLKFCPNCGEKLPEAAAFCPYCGFKFDGILPDNDSESEMTADLHGQSDDLTYDMNSSISSGGTSQNLYEYDSVYNGNNFDNYTQPPKKKKPIILIIAIISAAAAAMLIGFFVLAPMIAEMVGHDTDSKSTSSSEPAVTASPDDDGTGVTATPTLIPTATATPIPTATPTPVPTATPTEVPPQTISQPNIVDASTGQLIVIPNDTATSYAYPDSGNRVWSYGDVSGMTAGQVRLCINEIYAKHGYIFQNDNWLNYFKQKTWYSPTIPKASFGDQYLNSTEVANVKLLNKYYSDRKFPDY